MLMYRVYVYFLLILPSILSAQETRPGKVFILKKEYPGSAIDGYNIYIPNSCKQDSPSYPLIVFLQGGLAVGGEVKSILKWELPKDLLQAKSMKTKLDSLKYNTFLYVMPHLKYGQFYMNEEAIKTIIKEVTQKYNVDPQRVYLTGLSRGGHGTWGLASRIPEEFAAVAPICGSDKGIKYYASLLNLPIWVAHNVADNTVEYEESRWIVGQIEELSKKSFHRTLTVREADIQNDRIFTSSSNRSHPHNAWTEMYNDPKFYKWLLRFKKG